MLEPTTNRPRRSARDLRTAYCGSDTSESALLARINDCSLRPRRRLGVKEQAIRPVAQLFQLGEQLLHQYRSTHHSARYFSIRGQFHVARTHFNQAPGQDLEPDR